MEADKNKILSHGEIMNEEERKYYFMRTHLGMSPDEIYRETNIAEVEKIPSLTTTSLTYERTYEEEMAEKKSVQLAEDFLKKLGITVKTNYGYYRDAYSIIEVKSMDKFLEYLPSMDIISILDEIVQKLAKENWKDDNCQPEFWVSLNNEDMNNQSIMITIDHLGHKFTEKLFPRKDAHYGYNGLRDQMINMYNQTM